MRHYILTAILSLVCLSLIAQPSNEPTFKSDVETEKKPWTHLNFHNDPNDFQFAIVTDNTGGMRPGVFESAVVKLNLMQPEFVMSVGDLIEGYTIEQEQIDKEWDEFNGWVENLEMPFFYLPGNHDISNPVMQEDWEDRYGVRYYSFVYKDVLFITIDTDDSEEVAWYKMSDEQEQWVLDVLEKHQDVRWTFFFMHHPLWWKEGDENELNKIEAKLKEEGRDYTMFAGHVHRYMHNVRQGNNYYVLATTGGGSQLRGPQFGEFDQVTWVTMKDDGPKMANLWLDGILDMDIYNPGVDSLAKSLSNAASFDHLVLAASEENFTKGRVLLNVTNTSSELLHFKGRFFHHHQVNILDPILKVELNPGESKQFEIDLTAFPGASFDELDPLELNWTLSYDSSDYPDLNLAGILEIEFEIEEISVLTPGNRDIFLDELSVSTSSGWQGLDLRYTSDGSLPNTASPILEEAIVLDKGETNISVRYFTEDGLYSGIESRTFSKVKPIPSVKLKSSTEGLSYKYYEGAWKMLPDFDKLEVVATGTSTDLDVEKIAALIDHYGFVFEGYLNVPETGMYQLFTYSDDGTFFRVHDQLVVDNDGSHSPTLKGGFIALEEGYHPIRVDYFEDHGGVLLILGYQTEDMAEPEQIPAEWLVH